MSYNIVNSSTSSAGNEIFIIGDLEQLMIIIHTQHQGKIDISNYSYNPSVQPADNPKQSYKRIKVIMLLFGIILHSYTIMAQTDSLSLDYYFDDQGISTGIMIKTDLVSIIHGDMPLIVESRPKSNLSLEGGFGLLLPYYVHDFLPLVFSENKGIVNNRFGYSTRLHLKWYAKAHEKEYWGIQYYRRAFNHIKVNEWFFTRGDQRIIGKRLLVDIALGLGVRFQNAQKDDYIFAPDFSFIPIMPLLIRFGYISK